MQKELDQHIVSDSSKKNTADKSPKTTKVKQTFAGIFIGLGVFVLLLGGIVGLLHLKTVQTYIIGKITDKLEETLQADVKIAQFHYSSIDS